LRGVEEAGGNVVEAHQEQRIGTVDRQSRCTFLKIFFPLEGATQLLDLDHLARGSTALVGLLNPQLQHRVHVACVVSFFSSPV